jgi:hypothetical protein
MSFLTHSVKHALSLGEVNAVLFGWIRELSYSGFIIQDIIEYVWPTISL